MRSQILLVAALATVASAGARAEPEYAFRGFGTVGVTHSNNHDIDYVKGLTGSGVGKTRSTDFGLDTMAGLQLDATLASQWSLNLQVLSMRNADKTFAPHVEWANLKYAHSPNFSVRLGRVGLPVFMVSDYRLVGYANTWVRGPVEVYSLLPISSGDGLDMRYGFSIGDSIVSLQGCYTNTEFKIPSAGGSDDAKSKGQLSLAATYENGSLLLRLGHSQAKVEMMPSALLPLVGGLEAVAAAPIPGVSGAAAGLLNEFFARETDASFSGIGATYDDGKYLVQAEYTQRRMKRGIIPNVDAAYVLGGMRFGKLTPYAFHAMDRTKGPYTNANAETMAAAGMAMGPAGGGIVALGMAGRGIYAQRDLAQTTTALGVRYDFMKNVALKVQYDHIRPDSGAVGGTQPEKSVNSTNLLTINVDFVF